MTSLWIGTYPSAGIGTPSGRGEGVWRVELDPVTGALGDARLVAVAAAPSFLLATGGRLLAVGEDDPGTLAVLTVDGGATPAASASSGGSFPCHLALDPAGRHLWVANYGDGTLGELTLDDDGLPVGPTRRLPHSGAGPDPDRQEGPHAHFVVVAPGGRHVLVVDLGTDEVRRYRRGPDGLVPDGIALRLPPGTGPRHLAFSADGARAYLSAELRPALHVLAWRPDEATGEVIQSHPLHGPEASPSHLVLDGDRVVVAVRGTDVLAPFAVTDEGVQPLRPLPLPGRCPRHFAVVAGRYVVALQESHEVVALERDGTIVGRVTIPSPACVVPAG